MKIFKPDSLAMLYRNFRLGPDKLLALGMMAMFHFDRSERDALLSEAQLWVHAATAIGADTMLDAGLPKPAGEFLAYGAAHALAGTQVTQVEVALKVGAVRKSLYVFGDRHFTALGISAPQPFARMPLGPERAFGGVGYAANPLGRGHADTLDAHGLAVRALPNVELPRQLVVSKSDTPVPAGYGALAPDAPQRTALLGAFDERWLKKTWPHLPDDTHAEYFHAAARDQRVDGFFRGDERIEIGNMHPQRGTIVSALPKLRARCFVNQRSGADAASAQFKEVDARAETVWLFPELECGIVLYRAVVRVGDEEADDILHVMAEWENLADAPLPVDHYERVFKDLLPNPITPATPVESVAASAPAAAVPAAAAPALAAAVVPAAVSAPAPVSAEMAELDSMVNELETQTQQMLKQHGLSGKDLEKYLQPQQELSPMSMQELEQSMAKLEQDTQKMLQDHGLSQKDLEKYLNPPQQSEADLGQLKTMLQEVEQQTSAMLEQSGMSKQALIDLMAGNPELAHLAPVLAQTPVDLDQAFADLAAAQPAAVAAADLPLAAAAAAAVVAAPAAAVDSPAPAEPPPARLDREQVVQRHARGLNFAGLDLSGLDLSKLDLHGADFGAAVCEQTSFAHSDLSGARFDQALLQQADFSAANLTGVRLTRASAAGALFASAQLNDSELGASDFTGADFSGAQLKRCQAGAAIFDEAKMAGLQASDCDAARASFAQTDLSRADFSRARLGRAKFNGAALSEAQFGAAQCEQAEFYGVAAQQANFAGASLHTSRADASSQFARAVFSQANLGRACWEGVQIKEALLDRAVLDHADFSRAQASGANFAGACAKHTSFAKADLSDANLSSVNLFKGSLRTAELARASLQMANLYGVDFYDTAPTRASVEGSNLDQTLLSLRGSKA